MPSGNPTVAVRIPPKVRKSLEEKALARGYPSLTGLLREILTTYVAQGEGRLSRVNGCKPHNPQRQEGEGCPIINSLQGGFFCPYLRRLETPSEGGVTESSSASSPTSPWISRMSPIVSNI